jgi:putative addiction module component (TIGR02574 family)
MNSLLEKARHSALLLTQEDQHRLAIELLDAAGNSAETQSDVDAAWNAELLRRKDEILSGTAKAVPWEDVEASMAKEFGWAK